MGVILQTVSDTSQLKILLVSVNIQASFILIQLKGLFISA